ncbi:MAG TPA: LytTR family DNA-binding domain-containing protein [Gemmatimonadaceae bacterium]|nr:LytTR family DNA-binding domain-containing protein [Gemmatimonadaceae bacterium]
MSPRVLIADDEPPARSRVRTMLAGRADYEVIAEVGDGAEAVDVMLRDQPDLVFLDIKMPELDGFEVLQALETAEGVIPAIVFVTAFDAFAVKAFEVGALDYLLKPFDQARFDRALRNAAERVAARRPGIDVALEQLLRTVTPSQEFPVRFLVRHGKRMLFVRAEEIDWLDAQANYVRLHVAGRAHLLRDTMTAMDGKLDPEVFVRVHRSAIVNVDRIAQIEPHVHGELVITMKDGARLTTSATHSAKLRRLLR